MTRTTLCCSNWQFSHDGENGEIVSLPHSAFIEPEEIENPQIGTVFYRFTFDAPEEWREKIIYFEIGAAMQTAKISLNGNELFTHFGGYQRFFIPLSDYLAYGGSNTLEIELDNAPSYNMPPGKDAMHLDFCYHSGLYRDAKLHVYEPVHLSDELAVSIPAGGGVFIRMESLSDGVARLAATAHIIHEYPALRRFELLERSAGANDVRVECRIFTPDGECVFEAQSECLQLRPNCDHTFSFDISLDCPCLWTPDSPKLYRAEFRVFHNGIETDFRPETFGVRTIEFRRNGFYLNGVKTFLNGTNRHMEYPFVGNAVPPNAQWRDAILIKNGGHNTVRLSHYNQDPAFLDACDRIGLMVIPAIPGWQAYHPNVTFIQNAFRDCRELMRSLRNRPSVILWEVSLNEAYPPVWVNAEFHRIAHEEYPGPFCFTGGDTWGFFEGWDVLFPCDHMRSTGKSLFLREYGDWAFGGDVSTSRQKRGADMDEQVIQTWNFLWSLNRLMAVPGMVGGADWCFLDYNRGFSPPMERSGSLDIYRLPKIKYHFYQSQSDKEPVIFAVHHHNKLIVFSNCDEVELTRNGKSVCRRSPDSGPDSPYGKNGSPGWETALPHGFDRSGGVPFDGGNASHLAHPPFTFADVVPLSDDDVLTLKGFRSGAKAAEITLRKPGKPVRVETRVRTEGIDPVPGDLVFVDALLMDENGTLVPETHSVSLDVSGDAEMIGGMSETEAGIAGWLVRITGAKYEFHARMN